jgi:hypothetical protein
MRPNYTSATSTKDSPDHSCTSPSCLSAGRERRSAQWGESSPPALTAEQLRPLHAAFDGLRERAERDATARIVSADPDATSVDRRPSWGPPLILEGELLQLCRTLGYLKEDDKPIARLWSTFADPRKVGTALRNTVSKHGLAGIACRGFELHPGGQRGNQRDILFEAKLDKASQWTFGPRVHWYDPGNRRRRHDWECLMRRRVEMQDTIAKLGGDQLGLNKELAEISAQIAILEAEDDQETADRRKRHEQRRRVVELARERVLDFAGAPNVQMQLAAQLNGNCCICWIELSDPVSLERGIGPECLKHREDFIEDLHANGASKTKIVFLSGMPLEFVEAVLAERTSEKRRARAQKAKTTPKKKRTAVLSEWKTRGVAVTSRRIGEFGETKTTKTVRYREGQHATLIQHCAVFGDIKTELYKFTIEGPQSYAQHQAAMEISYLEPRKRNWACIWVTPDSIRYSTIVSDDGEVRTPPPKAHHGGSPFAVAEPARKRNGAAQLAGDRTLRRLYESTRPSMIGIRSHRHA